MLHQPKKNKKEKFRKPEGLPEFLVAGVYNIISRKYCFIIEAQGLGRRYYRTPGSTTGQKSFENLMRGEDFEKATSLRRRTLNANSDKPFKGMDLKSHPFCLISDRKG